MTAKPCPCGATDYAACCGCYHGGAPAPDAAALMRSRYSAYVLKLKTYLLGTGITPPAPPRFDLADSISKWLGLGLKKHTPESADRATVEFVARKIGSRAHRARDQPFRARGRSMALRGWEFPG
jgi:SEC-C motif-containing protein